MFANCAFFSVHGLKQGFLPTICVVRELESLFGKKIMAIFYPNANKSQYSTSETYLAVSIYKV